VVVHYGTAEKRICRSVPAKPGTAGGNTECRTVTNDIPNSGGGCKLDPTTYDAIKAAISSGNGTGSPVDFAFITAHSVQDFTGATVCARPFTKALPADPAAPLSGNILGTEESLIVRYEINGGKRNNQIEKRLCHTVADKTDCFRLFK
jgi:hypothetical protein